MNVGVFHLGRHVGTAILVLSSFIVGILSSVISWRVRGGTFILVGVLVLCFYLLKLALYTMTHNRIVQRFPAERDKSAQRIALALLTELLLLVPFGLTCVLYLSDPVKYELANHVCLLVSRLTVISNGFVYGYTNRRVMPHFYSIIGLKSPTQPEPKLPKGPGGEVNVAFSDEVL